MNKTAWSDLRQRITGAMDESHVKVGPDNFYRAQTMREVLSWMEEAHPTPVRSDEPVRLVCGTGSGADGDYEVVRRVRAKEYRVEWASGKWRKVSLAEAVNLVQKPQLNTPGLSAFDKAWASR